MRIPFVGRGEINPEQSHFITASRGGSAFLFAGALFWAVAGLTAVWLEETTAGYVYLFGGFLVPVFGFVFARLQRIRFTDLRGSDHFSLVVIAAAITPICLPVLFALIRYDPRLVAPALTLIDSAHFPILMWIHLDYTYFLAAYAKFLIGLAFLFWWPEHALVIVGVASALVSVMAAIAVHRASKDPQRAYLPKEG